MGLSDGTRVRVFLGAKVGIAVLAASLVVVGGLRVWRAASPGDPHRVQPEPFSAGPSPTSSTSPSTTAGPATLPGADDWCRADGSTLLADLEGTGGQDLVSLRWIEDRGGPGPSGAVLGVCTADGRVDELPTSGMAEELRVLDLQPDGRDEVLFRGTSCCAVFLYMAVVENGRIREVSLANGEPLRLVEGVETEPESSSPVSRAIGCLDVDDDGRREIIQATVTSTNGVLDWTTRAFALNEATAVRVATQSGTLGKGEITFTTAAEVTSACNFQRR